MSTEPNPWANGGGGSVDLGIASTSPAVGRQATAGDGEEIYQRGVLIDRYVVLSMLGEGGMGIVYVAYDPELDRSVAIKLLHPDLAAAANQDPQARLLREAQALARLSHPNVVAIHDVGTLGTRVWLAMELVKGRTLKVWQGQRSWREVVDAYCMAGRGLLAAHEVGLVHRDFKPDNVMVGDDGRIRVMDFGLARQEDRPGGSVESPRMTERMREWMSQTGEVQGTPEYMAPEQWTGAMISAHTDQFSFCVALYRALYGRSPHGDSSAWQGIREAVLRGVVLAPPQGARVPGRLFRILRRGLAVTPEERWPGMAELLEALGQTLRRTPLRTAGALGLLVLVSAGSYAAARSGATESDCATASRALDGVWDEERREVLKTAFLATGVSFAEDAWQRVEGQLDAYSKVWVSAYQASCEEHAAGVQTSRLTDLRVACLGRHRSRLAALVEVFRGADRSVVENAVQAVAALPSVSACADSEALLAVPPPSDPQVVQRVEQLRLQLAQVEALELTGGFEQGLEQAKKVRDEAMALGYAPLKAEAALRLGNLLMAVGQSAEANEAFVDVIKQAIVHDLHALGGEAAAKQIYVLSQGLQKHAEALTIRTVAEALVERSNDDGRATALLHNNLGVVYTLLRELDSAQAHYERSIALLQARSGAQNPLIAAAYHNLGELNLKRGRLDVARESYTQALEHFTRILGATHPYVAHPIAGLGELALKEGAHDAALDSFTRALALMEAAYGLEHPYLIQPLIGLGAAHAARGQLAEARARYARAAAIAERLGVVEAPQLGQALEGEAGAIVAENPREARVLFERAVQAYAAALGKDTAMQAPAAVRAGELAAQQGDAPAAVRWFELVLSLPADATVEWRSRAAVSLARALSVQPEATARICDLLAEAELSLADSDPLRSEARSLRADRCGGQPDRE